MHRESKPKRNLKQYSHNNKHEETTNETPFFIEVRKFTIAMIYCGFPEILEQEFSILLNNAAPSYYFIRKGLELIRPIIKLIAETSVADENAKMPQNASVCVYGPWDHRRNGKLLVFDVICLQTKKIVDFNLLIKISKNKKGNTNVSPQALEEEAFELVLTKLQNNDKIIEIIKDGDIQMDNLIKSS